MGHCDSRETSFECQAVLKGCRGKWGTVFESFITNPSSSVAAKMSYARVMQWFYDKMTGYEATATSCDHEGNFVDEDDLDLMDFVGMKGNQEAHNEDEALLKQMKKGIDYDWGESAQVRPFKCAKWC
jgi:hypothetical protein